MSKVDSAEIHVIVEFRVRPKHLAAASSLLSEAALRSRTEPGNLYYYTLSDTTDPHIVYFVDGWASEEALATHLASAAVKQTVDTILPMLDGPIVMKRARPLTTD